MKYVEAYYEGTEEAVMTVSDKTCECECCADNLNAAVNGAQAITKGPDGGDVSEPIGCDGCTVEVEECSPAPGPFTVLGPDGLDAEMSRIGIYPHDLVAIVKLDELKALLAAQS